MHNFKFSLLWRFHLGDADTGNSRIPAQLVFHSGTGTGSRDMLPSTAVTREPNNQDRSCLVKMLSKYVFVYIMGPEYYGPP